MDGNVIPQPMNCIQAKICLSATEFEIWNSEYRRRLESGSLVRDAERFALKYLQDLKQQALAAGKPLEVPAGVF